IYVVHIVLKLVFGQSKKNTLNLSPKAKEKRLVLKTSFSLCFRTGTSALPSGRFRSPSKMLGFWRGNTRAGPNAAGPTSYNFAESTIWRCFLTDVRTFFEQPPN